MEKVSTITSKGQITIPVEYRREDYGFMPCTKVLFSGYDTRLKALLIRPLKDITDLRGYFTSPKKYNKKAARKAYLKAVISGKV